MISYRLFAIGIFYKWAEDWLINKPLVCADNAAFAVLRNRIPYGSRSHWVRIPTLQGMFTILNFGQNVTTFCQIFVKTTVGTVMR